MKRPILFSILTLAIAFAGLSGCEKRSYPLDKLEDALQHICRREYGIEDIEVKTVGNTIGVYLPLKKLFSSNFNESVVQGKLRRVETLFEPSPESMDKVADVLFSMSRVILSTDESLKFYVLQATDVEHTGLQLVLTGYADDVRRLRVWDIPRSEYQKRLIRETRQNRAVMWHKPVRKFFDLLETADITTVRERYFGAALTDESIQNLFFHALYPKGRVGSDIKWDIREMRSASLERGEVLVYVRVRPNRNGTNLLPEGREAKYLFLVDFRGEEPGITRIIPFQYINENGGFEEIMPKEFDLQQNVGEWIEEFELEPVKLGSFLAKQLTRRIQMLVSMDERIHNTFRKIRLGMEFHDENPEAPYFALTLDQLILKDFQLRQKGGLAANEDVLYLLELSFREIVTVLRSYGFKDFGHILLTLDQTAGQWVIDRKDLEKYRRKKVDIQGLLSLA